MTVSVRLHRLSGLLTLAVLAAACGADASTTAPVETKPVVASLVIAGGNEQSAPVNSKLASTLTVMALTASGTPLAGVTVNFTVSGGAATVLQNPGTCIRPISRDPC